MQNSTEINTNLIRDGKSFFLIPYQLRIFISHFGHFLCSKAVIQDFAYAIVLINVDNNCHYCHYIYH